MKLKSCHGVIVAICILYSAVALAGDEGTGEEKRPVAFFPEIKFEFPVVVEGTQVTHDYTIQNRGDEQLEVEKVKTG
jgi:hypothetical protein